MKSYNMFDCPVVEDSDGELCLEFPDEVLEALDLKVGDVLLWEPSIGGHWFLRKKENEDDGNKDQ